MNKTTPPVAAAASALDPWLTLRDVSQIVKLQRTAIYDRLKRKAFPAPLRVGARCVRWRSSDIAKWMAEHGN